MIVQHHDVKQIEMEKLHEATILNRLVKTWNT